MNGISVLPKEAQESSPQVGGGPLQTAIGLGPPLQAQTGRAARTSTGASHNPGPESPQG